MRDVRPREEMVLFKITEPLAAEPELKCPQPDPLLTGVVLGPPGLGEPHVL